MNPILRVIIAGTVIFGFATFITFMFTGCASRQQTHTYKATFNPTSGTFECSSGVTEHHIQIEK